MSISDFDKTRQNIRANELTDLDRKELMRKFIDHGGQVVNDHRKKNVTFDRQKQMEIRKQLDSHREKLSSKTQKRKSSTKTRSAGNTVRQKKTVSGNPLRRFFDLLRIRFALFSLGVTDLSASVMRNRFFEHFLNEYKTAIMELQSTYIRVFKGTSADVPLKIVNSLDKISPMHFELIEMGASIYDSDMSSSLLDEYIAFREKVFYPLDVATAVSYFFEKMLHLNNYQEMLFSSFDKAMEIAAKLNKEYAGVYQQNRKRLRNSIYVIFNRLFPRLYWLVCLYNSQVLPLFDTAEIESILGMPDDLRPGNRIANAPGKLDGILGIRTLRDESPDEEESERAREELRKKTAPKISEEVKRGLALHSQIDRKSLAKKFFKEPVLVKQYVSDPIIRSYIVFREFDEEYSVLLATNKIKINTAIDWHDARNSHREKLQVLFNTIRNCDKSYEDYFSLVEILEKVREDKPVSQQQYMNYSKRITELEKEKSVAAKNTRSLVRQFMSDLADLFAELNQDMENDQKVVVNPQDEIEFDFIEGTKKLQNKKIFQAINMTIDFASAFIYRLSPGGDLAPEQKLKQKNQNEAAAPVMEPGTTALSNQDSSIDQESERQGDVEEDDTDGEKNDFV